MSSYFDDADTILRSLFAAQGPAGSQEESTWNLFWRDYHAWENKLVEDCIKACRARGFPQDLRMKIFNIVHRGRIFKTSLSPELNEREASSLLSMRMSFLSSSLHSVFHEVATYGAKNDIRHLTDSPGWMAKRAPLEKGLSR